MLDFELRPLMRGDRFRFAALAGDYDVARFTSDIPQPFSPDEALEWIEARPGDVRLGIIADQALVGAVGYFLRRSGVAELGFWIGRPWWGRGLATSASRLLIERAIATTRIPAFTSHHFVDNPASGRVLEKLGFVVMGRGREHSRARGESVDTVVCWLARP
jgi:RimJ/RimL family protein N-acetyltransferase